MSDEHRHVLALCKEAILDRLEIGPANVLSFLSTVSRSLDSDTRDERVIKLVDRVLSGLVDSGEVWRGPEPDPVYRLPAPTDLRANVMAFHREVVGGETPEYPCVPEEPIARRRLRLITEEYFEVVRSALKKNQNATAKMHQAFHLMEEVIAHAELDVDLVALAHELADLAYVTEGGFIGFGIDSRPVHAEIQRANMGKKGGPKRLDGKALKPLAGSLRTSRASSRDRKRGRVETDHEEGGGFDR